MTVQAIQCPLCDEIVWSRHRHDCRSCSCGAVSIDGGRDYTRMLWDDKRVPMPQTFEYDAPQEEPSRAFIIEPPYAA